MYKKVPTDMNFVAREDEVSKFWKENKIFEKTEEKKGPSYVFYDGPPTANGKPHIGHVETRVIKDMIPRYHTMKGANSPRKAGWDTHGLPVEIEVEKKLGLNGKDQIEKYGIEPFIEQCKESVWKYKSMWEKFSDCVGFWADMEHPYVTYENTYIESEWWALKEIYNKGLLYKGFKVVPYCPRCGTPLSSHEVAQGYKKVKERSAVVRFKAVGEDAYFLAWTTTPWTLPSNVALCVNPDDTYVKVKAIDGFTYYLAEELADTVLGPLAKEEGQKAYEVLETMKGKDLEYREYEPLYDCAVPVVEKQHKKAFFIECDSYVTMTDGTGIVHEAPAFGEDDARVGRKYDMPFVQLVDEKGLMKEETPFAGLFVKDADPEVLKDLDKRGLLFDAPKFEHDYPFCWRCDTPLLYYAHESWFIKMTAVKDDLIANNKTINWVPKSIGTGRFGSWLENVQDWDLSRNRYWGTPLNVWECPDCGERMPIGSIQELKDKSYDCPDEIELHRPYVDNVHIKCPKCGGTMTRVPEVIDCWFDSGSMPFAQHHYPFENQELFKEQFPADFISEAVDQTRGWFYSLLAISTLLFNKAPFKNCVVLGLVLDEDGQKMSKSKGNAIDPMDALRKHGADAIRWYFYTNSAPWLPNRFYDKAVIEGQRKFLGTLWNTYAFFVLYANIDNFEATKYTIEWDKLSVMDKWCLSKMNKMIQGVDENLAAYRIPEAASYLQNFVDDLSNWYVRRCRSRFWAKGMSQDKINAYMTLYTALVTVAKAAAPMIPFMTEEIYQNLVRSIDKNAPESVHLADFPKVNEEWVDKDLEANMDEARDIVTLGRACRNGANIKNRQPLGRMIIKADHELDSYFTDIIKDELNIKNVEFADENTNLLDYSFKPQLKVVGPKYGKQVGMIRQALGSIENGIAAKEELDSTGSLKVTLSDGTELAMTPDELLIDAKQEKGLYALSDKGITVAIDTTLTEELLQEGYVREVISKIQTMRKDSSLEVTDHINVYFQSSDKLNEIVTKDADILKSNVLCDDLHVGEAGGTKTADWKINGEDATIGIEKA